jgi:glycine/D-amino acid oxidase-like deaminating enzyme
VHGSAESVVVVGAGVSGLTTGICLAEAGRLVRVWTAEPPQQTTSVVAGALWGPSFQEPMAKTMAWTDSNRIVKAITKWVRGRRPDWWAPEPQLR